MHKSHQKDVIFSAKIFAFGFFILMITAALGLNPWPLFPDLSAAFSFELLPFLGIFFSYGIIFSVIFWCSRPSKKAQVSILFLWLALTLASYVGPLAPFQFSLLNSETPTVLEIQFAAMSIPSLIYLLLRTSTLMFCSADKEFELRLRSLLLLTFLFISVPGPALALTAALHPYTLDMFAFHFDLAAGLNITHFLVPFINDIPALPELVTTAYRFTPLGMLSVALLQLHKPPRNTPSALLVWVVMTACAFTAYNFFPITGPIYLFGTENFVKMLAHPEQLHLEITAPIFAARNGMPSMHFGWMLAASILWWRSGTTWWSRAIFIIITTLTAIATIYTGEHYVVDLIVATPFVLASIALCTTSVSWSQKSKQYAALSGFATWIVWVVLLRNAVPWLGLHTWACGLILALTAGIVFMQSRWLSSTPSLATNSFTSQAISIYQNAQAKIFERKIALMFFASGFAALVYQVLFAKKLALVFGSTSTATLTVLATFLGGMAIGSLIGGKFAEKVKRPLFVYAIAEGLIAAYCLITPFLFDLIQAIYIALATGQAADAPSLLILRVTLGACVLLVPTVLMGATLPLLALVLNTKTQSLGSKVALLYFANTAGATFGALLTSYAIIPFFGVNRTTLIAATLNLLVSLGAIEIAKHLQTTPSNSTNLDHGQDQVRQFFSKKISIIALVTLGVGGILSLGLEVVYVHMLSIVAGNSVYAFGLMLATFLLGLACGGEGTRRLLLDINRDRTRLLAFALLGLSFSVASGVWFWNDIPDYFASFVNHPAARSFSAREAIRGLVCAMIMLPPTLFIGAAYVLGMDIITASSRNGSVKMLGIGAALNTLGNITGVLIFGFLLIPMFGGLQSTRIIAISALSLAIVVLLFCTVRLKRVDLAWGLATLFAVIGSFQVQLNYDALSSGANVYFAGQQWGKVVAHAESIDGGLTTISEDPESKIKTLLTNGKFQGTDSWNGEMQAQIGFAFAPLLHQEKRDRALIIGYGTGVTSRVFHDAGFKQLDIAELSNDVVNLANNYFPQVNSKVSTLNNVKLHVTDGRNLLLLTPPEHRYDVVSIEITSIWFAGAASLYNKEFYDLVRSRMAADGVLQQWVQLHRLSPIDILTVISTLRSSFNYVSLYIIGGQGILIATNDATRQSPNSKAIHELENTERLDDIKSKFNKKIPELIANRTLSSAGVDEFIKKTGVEQSLWISTDDNLRLEYSTPKANVNDSQISTQRNLEMLQKFSLVK